MLIVSFDIKFIRRDQKQGMNGRLVEPVQHVSGLA